MSSTLNLVVHFVLQVIFNPDLVVEEKGNAFVDLELSGRRRSIKAQVTSKLQSLATEIVSLVVDLIHTSDIFGVVDEVGVSRVVVFAYSFGLFPFWRALDFVREV
ncbi:EamA family transporter [Sesbania bispinosa]|nr:EamA family transporter [Sesbania bispinosa]